MLAETKADSNTCSQLRAPRRRGPPPREERPRVSRVLRVGWLAPGLAGIVMHSICFSSAATTEAAAVEDEVRPRRRPLPRVVDHARAPPAGGGDQSRTAEDKQQQQQRIPLLTTVPKQQPDDDDDNPRSLLLPD